MVINNKKHSSVMAKKTKNKTTCALMILNFVFLEFFIIATAYMFLLGFSAIQIIQSFIGIFLIAVMLEVLFVLFDKTPFPIIKKTKRRK